jgi:pimeloyl-ACP methyl ester carboxylesterase
MPGTSRLRTSLGIPWAARPPRNSRSPTRIGALRNQLAFDSRTRLWQVEVPTLALWAKQDVIFPEPDQAALRAALDAADLAAWIVGKQPTGDLHYANPHAAGSVLTEAGTAAISTKRKASGCAP